MKEILYSIASLQPSWLELVYRPTQSDTCYMGIALPVGSRHEGKEEMGLAHLVEHMLFKGTKLRNAKQIIRRLEEIGGELNAYTGKEETIVYASFPKQYSHRALQLLLDITLRSRFDEAELSKEKGVIIDEILSYEDSPSELIWDEFENLLFGRHPLGHNILGTEESVSSFTSEVLKAFHTRHYHTVRMLVVVQGDVDFHKLVTFASTQVKGFSTYDYKVPKERPRATPRTRPKKVTVDKGTHQRHVMIGTHGYPYSDPRSLELKMLASLLGGSGMSSRLHMSLREDAGLVYHVECSYTAYQDTGMVAIYLACAPEHMERAIQLTNDELKRISSEPLSPKELTALKEQLKGQLIVASDQAENSFLSLSKYYLQHRKPEKLTELMARIDAVTAESLHEVAQEIFPPERMYHLIYK